MTSAVRQPLQGVRVLVTRARPQAGSFARRLRDSGAVVIELPTIAIRDPDDWSPVDAAIERLSTYEAVIFTSANGVDRFRDRLRFHGLGADALRSSRLIAIGPATAAALERNALDVEAVPAEYRGERVLDLAAGMLRVRDRSTAGEAVRVLIPRASEAREVLPDGLRDLGAEVDVVAVYRTVLPEGSRERLEEALRDGIDCITFTSSSTVRNFVRMAEGGLRESVGAGVTIACIGPITAETAREAGFTVTVEPKEYTVEGLCRALTAHYAAAR